MGAGKTVSDVSSVVGSGVATAAGTAALTAGTSTALMTAGTVGAGLGATALTAGTVSSFFLTPIGGAIVGGLIMLGGAIIGGLMSSSENEKARKEAKAIADQNRQDWLKQTAITNKNTQTESMGVLEELSYVKYPFKV